MKSISACHREEGFISEYRNEHRTEITLCAGYKIQYAHLILHFADGLAFDMISEKSSKSCETVMYAIYGFLAKAVLDLIRENNGTV